MGKFMKRRMEQTAVHTAPSAQKGVGVTNGHQPIEQHPNGRNRPSQKSPQCPALSCRKNKIVTYLISYRMAQSTLIKRGQVWGCSNATISRRHVCLPHDGAWMAHLPPMLALLHCQGQKHVCFRLRHTRGAHRVGTSTSMMGHPGLPPDLGSWDHPNQRVRGMCTMVARTHNDDDKCVGCVR